MASINKKKLLSIRLFDFHPTKISGLYCCLAVEYKVGTYNKVVSRNLS